MLIRSKIARTKPGTNPPEPIESFLVEFGEKRERQYEFKVDANGEHVCDVKHSEDTQALIAITEGYEIHPSVLDAVESTSDKAAAKAKADAEAKAEAEAIRKAAAERKAAQEQAEADAQATADAAKGGNGKK